MSTVDKSIFLEDANGTVYLAEPAGADGAIPLYRLIEQSESTPPQALPASLGPAPSPETDNRPRDITPRRAEGAAVTARKQGTP